MCYSYRKNEGDKFHYIVRGGDGLIVEEFKTEADAKRRIMLRNFALVIEQKKQENWFKVRSLLPQDHSLFFEEISSGI